MSFFQSIKGTLGNVKRDIGAGFKSLTNTEPTLIGRKEDRKGFDEDAGATLLHKYQEYWQELHLNFEESASKAQKADEIIGTVHVRLKNEHSTLCDFTAELSSLPQLTEQIQEIVSQIGTLNDQMTSLENLMVTLEDVCEQGELQRNKQRHQSQLATYERSRAFEIERAKVQLSKDHAKHVQAFESKLQRNLKDRQEAFEATYHEEIQNYKHTGQTKLKPNIAVEGPSLGDIDIGEDSAVLDEFLKSDDEAHSVPKTKEHSESQLPSTTETVSESQPPLEKDASAKQSEHDSSSEVTSTDGAKEPQIEVTPDGDISDQDLKASTSPNNNTEETQDSKARISQESENSSDNVT